MSEENIKKSNAIWKYSAFVLVILLIIGAFVYFGKSNGGVVNGERVQISVGNSPILGQESAPVTIVLFSDFSCPYCAAASGQNEIVASSLRQRDSSWKAPVSGIIRDYVDSGKAKIVFKYYPGHGLGQQAHLVSLCLNEQGLFWKFHDGAFADYESTNDLDKMKAIAEEIGADMSLLEKCLTDNQQKYTKELSDEIDEGKAAGVQGTPTFYVNGLKIEGAVSYSDIKKVIDSELSK
ncbi:MAG: thioredoxin domain-containing protein [Nanoarchaeota archaeon]